MMNINKNKLILSALGILAVSILGFTAFLPAKASAQNYNPNYYYPNYYPYNNYHPSIGGGSAAHVGSGNGYTYYYDYNNYNNGANPVIYTVNPTSNTTNNMVLSVTGINFFPNSIIYLNNVAKPTRFINSTSLSVTLSSYDILNPGDHTISVYNPSYGVSSNLVFLTINNTYSYVTNTKTKTVTTNTSSTSKTTNNNTSTDSTGTTTTNTDNDNNNGLAANALFGANGFMPINLIQWIIFGILILLAIVLWRKVYISDREKAKPLKHA